MSDRDAVEIESFVVDADDEGFVNGGIDPVSGKIRLVIRRKEYREPPPVPCILCAQDVPHWRASGGSAMCLDCRREYRSRGLPYFDAVFSDRLAFEDAGIVLRALEKEIENVRRHAHAR